MAYNSQYSLSDPGDSSNNLITLEIKGPKGVYNETNGGETSSSSTDKSIPGVQELSTLLIEAKGIANLFYCSLTLKINVSLRN